MILRYYPFVFIFILLTHFSLPAQAQKKSYVKRDIVEARYGDAQRQAWARKAYQAKKNLDQKIIGQERSTFALQEALIQYGDTFGTRDQEPVALHFIGFPGIGKSALINELIHLGFPVKTFNMQAYDARQARASDFGSDIANAQYRINNNPVIFVFDEIDKIPEITATGEITQPAIGIINEILTDGRATISGAPHSFNNVLIITTMNFSPNELEHYTQNILKTSKSYYDFSLEDFKAFDDWLNTNPGARYSVLSHLFRTNTVSRLAPNTSIFKPLNREDYTKITRSNIEASVVRLTQQGVGANRITTTYSQTFVDYLSNLTLVPSSGARETVFRVNRLTDQLIGFATKFQDPKSDVTLDLPRKIHLDVKDGKITITVIPQKLKNNELIDLESFAFEVNYMNDVRLFDRPTLIQPTPPAVKNVANKREKPISRKQILESRFPRNAVQAKGLAGKINKIVIGQEIASRYIETEISKYLGRSGPALKEPPFTFIAGFPGIGKSMIINTAAGLVEIPVVRIGMQQFTGDSIDTVNQFTTELLKKTDAARGASPTGKYILLLEEIDKIHEVNPQNGAIVNRPVMGMIKDLLAEGQLHVMVKNGSDFTNKTIDIRGAYTCATMNFGADLFGFKADPRLTTAQDMLSAWARLSTRPADLKNILGRLFLPETISRVISNFIIMKPLALPDYEKLIDGVIDQTSKERLFNREGIHSSQIDIELSAEYKRYLLNETVIPSEGARYTSLKSRSLVLSDIEHALKKIKKTSKLSASPFTLTLDYVPQSECIVYRAKDLKTGTEEILDRRQVLLTFPRPEVNGYLDPFRTLVSVHEFGHAYMAARAGLRFELVTAIPPQSGTGGYMKLIDNGMSARSKIAQLYSVLAARVTEKIFYSKDPTNEASVLDITSGASSDIRAGTQQIHEIIYELGFDPNGGTISRVGTIAPHQAKFEELPSFEVDALGKIMRRMEKQIMDDFLSAHDIAWFRDKIGQFGRAGTLREDAFYSLIDYPYPGEGSGFLGDNHTIQETLKGVIDPTNPVAENARGYRQGNTQTTALENMDRYLEAFKKAVQEELHGARNTSTPSNCNTILGGAV